MSPHPSCLNASVSTCAWAPGDLPAAWFPPAWAPVCCQHQPSVASQAVFCALCIQLQGQELGATLAPRADVKSGYSPALRLQGQAAEHLVQHQEKTGAWPPAVHGVCSWEAAGRLMVGAPNSQAVAGQSGCN